MTNSIIVLAPVIDTVAGVEIGTVPGLFSLDLNAIKIIKEDIEADRTRLEYHNGSLIILSIPFTFVINQVIKLNSVSIMDIPQLKHISSSLNVFLTDAEDDNSIKRN